VAVSIDPRPSMPHRNYTGWWPQGQSQHGAGAEASGRMYPFPRHRNCS